VTRVMILNSSWISTKIMCQRGQGLPRRFRTKPLNSIGFQKYPLTPVIFLRAHRKATSKSPNNKRTRVRVDNKSLQFPTRIRLPLTLILTMPKTPARQALLTRAQNKIVSLKNLTRKSQRSKRNKTYQSSRNSQAKIKKKRCEIDQARINIR